MTDRIEKLRAFLAQSPDDAFLNHALALEYVKRGEEDAARSYFEENVAKRPSYVATYYHLGKLLERIGEAGQAIVVYEQGMEAARAAGDMHSLSELRSVYEELLY